MTWDELKPILDEHCEDMKRDIPGFLYYGVVKCSDGEVVGYASGGRPELSDKVSSETDSHLAIMREVKEIINRNSSVSLHLDFITIETDKITYIITLSSGGSVFSLTGLDRKRANLGYAKNLLQKCVNQFSDVLDGIFLEA